MKPKSFCYERDLSSFSPIHPRLIPLSTPPPLPRSSLSLRENWLFSGFDKCRSQSPVTSSTAAGAGECCESESDLLHFISSLHALKENSDTSTEKKKKKHFSLGDAVNAGSCGGH